MLYTDQILFQTFFSDKMGINLSDAHKHKIWAKDHEVMEIEIPRHDVKINCWGAISFRGATSLHIYKTTLKKDLYQEILEEYRTELDDLYPRGWYFAHDQHKFHLASEKWMQNQEFGRVVFPTYSPDLNLFENLWSAPKIASPKIHLEQRTE